MSETTAVNGHEIKWNHTYLGIIDGILVQMVAEDSPKSPYEMPLTLNFWGDGELRHVHSQPCDQDES